VRGGAAVKAFLLAAGVGSRLRPITDTVPKCMVDIGGRPLLGKWLDDLHAAGADEVVVNLHHLADAVRGFLSTRTGPPAVRTSYEPDLLGSAGTLRAHAPWVAGAGSFLVCNADNLTDFDLRRLAGAHQVHGGMATLAVFRSPNPSAGGVVETDMDGIVTGFTEKPDTPATDLVNAGMYVFQPDVIDLIEGPGPRDIGHHLLPRLVGRARVVLVDGYFRDIGTLDSYQRARQEWTAR
jgi:mannose-1-phosphate guanylyltransferase